jgi:hypothetical protein
VTSNHYQQQLSATEMRQITQYCGLPSPLLILICYIAKLSQFKSGPRASEIEGFARNACNVELFRMRINFVSFTLLKFVGCNFKIGQVIYFNVYDIHVWFTFSQWRNEGRVWGVQQPPPPPNSEVLTKLSRIPSSVENTSATTQ